MFQRKKFDFKLFEEELDQEFLINDTYGRPVDLTGLSWRFEVGYLDQPSYDYSMDIVYSTDFSGAISGAGAAEGKVVITLPKADITNIFDNAIAGLPLDYRLWIDDKATYYGKIFWSR